jgi:glycolate oxidase FAD binding subunit
MLNKVQTTPDPLVATETVRPSTAEEVAAALKRASDERKSAVIRGAGTKMDWGQPAPQIDVMLDMRQLNRILAHEHGDLTATIEAGATLRDVNHALARHRQWLPLDPPFAEEATIGGILATNDSGPLRHRYGTPRDLVIGIQLATTDGVLAKAGGRVVKNVAGYDLSKLVTGSFGSLAAIVSATFKLSPIPSASKTMIVAVQDAVRLGDAVRTVMASQLEPIAFELDTRRSTPRPLSAQRAVSSADSASSAFNVRGRDGSVTV